MNNLFKNGDYVLLEDCKAFDEKFGLEKDSTMWSVARKMEGGKPDRDHMKLCERDTCVGLYGGASVAWHHNESLTTKLTVEDVLYRSKDGLTLDELSKIHGAFEGGKTYECVGGCSHYFKIGTVYATNGDGMLSRGGNMRSYGNITKFKPVTAKAEWVPSVGEEVIVHNDSDFVIDYGTECLGKNATVVAIFKDGEVTVTVIKYNHVNYCFRLSMLKPIDQERERVIKKATDLSETLDDCYSPRDFAIALYDAGMIKEGNS